MSPRAKTWMALVVALVAAGLLFWLWQAREEAEVNAAALAAQARREERDRRTEGRWERLREESAQLIPSLLGGEVYLGMSMDDARRARPDLLRSTDQNPDEPDLVLLEERFQNGARAVFAFERESQRLQRVQVLSMLPSADAIAPHLIAMNEQYGSPTGIWDCPQTGGVPTRRFTWRHGQTTVADVFLVYGGRVSVTLYVAPTGIIGRSLQMAACHPITREELDSFPVASPEQMMQDQPVAPGGRGRPPGR